VGLISRKDAKVRKDATKVTDQTFVYRSGRSEESQTGMNMRFLFHAKAQSSQRRKGCLATFAFILCAFA